MAGIKSRGLRFGAFIVLFVLGESSAPPAFSQALSGKGGISFAGGFAPVVKRVRPAVVNIASSQIVRDTPEETFLFRPPCSRGLQPAFTILAGLPDSKARMF